MVTGWIDPADHQRMLDEQLRGRGIHDERVLQAFGRVPRERFVPWPFRARAYDDAPLPIGRDQTVSQPYIVALMTQALALTPRSRVLEVGTGSGYQTAILAELAEAVYTVEWDACLLRRALQRLRMMGCRHIDGQLGDGALGWPAHHPYDGILVAAAAAAVPPPLIEQLGELGRLVMPVGTLREQELVLLTKRGRHLEWQRLCGCLFVPLRGPHGWVESL